MCQKQITVTMTLWVCRAWILIRFKNLRISVKWAPLFMQKLPKLSAVISLLKSPKTFLLPSNCPLSIPLFNSELRRIMSSNQRKGDIKLATLQKSLLKAVPWALNIFTEVLKKKSEIQTIAQMVADINAIVEALSYVFLLK